MRFYSIGPDLGFQEFLERKRRQRPKHKEVILAAPHRHENTIPVMPESWGHGFEGGVTKESSLCIRWPSAVGGEFSISRGAQKSLLFSSGF